MRVVQINRQPHFGGGEVYTAFLCRAFSALGISTRLLVHPRSTCWRNLPLPPDTEIIAAPPCRSLEPYLPTGPLWLLGHGPLPEELRAPKPKRLRTAIVHMPVQGRNPRAYEGHDRLFAVSAWVREGLQAAGLPVWPQPLYGVAELERKPGEDNHSLRRYSRYDWDRRKLRDRVFSWFEPFVEALRPHPPYARRPGLTLGIVSRITPIKQFPRMFSILAPILARYSQINLEIFGAGGYASIRDLDRALAPIIHRVRYWGHQQNVVSAYRGIDYLLTGLPEKEALGLNVIEAQACGTPVLAPAAPPFTETVLPTKTGYLYRDPREDQGADFERLIRMLLSQPTPLEPLKEQAHLKRFSFDAFQERLVPVLEWAYRASAG
ncbi:MAG: glycosyltransferase [Rhodocyclaceae bacterium]|nr:glycosyltransferase [Rhodocyclaceae bacterium]